MGLPLEGIVENLEIVLAVSGHMQEVLHVIVDCGQLFLFSQEDCLILCFVLEEVVFGNVTELL